MELVDLREILDLERIGILTGGTQAGEDLRAEIRSRVVRADRVSVCLTAHRLAFLCKRLVPRWRHASNSHPCALAMAAIRPQSGSCSDGGGRVRLPAGSLIAMTRSSKPPGVTMKSIRQPASPTAYRWGMSRGPKT